ncbi:MAG: DUF1848 domain-containing protein [Lachnospiraceae bacterium]|nr:DUF1848 domain-containing protein [Lachnospiraceae bacterium]
MILSVSRRTDIPNYYSDWFLNRIKEGYLYVRNPMNAHQVSKIILSPELVDCIVFWTKNPEPMLDRLEELAPYPFYFQFTLTGYGSDIECNVPHKKRRMIPIFQELSRRIGQERVIWRYDPILFTQKYTPEYHLKAFEQIADAIRGYTSKCVISFVDAYTKNAKSMAALAPYMLPDGELTAFAGEIARIAAENSMRVGSCAEKIDLADCGIEHNCCIDKELIEKITGSCIQAGKDKNQRIECGCVESIEVGTYDTCRNDCLYCYANNSRERILRTSSLYDVTSPILCGQITEEDRITERKVKSLRKDV